MLCDRPTHRSDSASNSSHLQFKDLTGRPRACAGGKLAALSGGGGRMTTLALEPRLERFAVAATDDGHAAVWSLDGSVRRVAALQNPSGSFFVAAAFLPRYPRGQGGPEDLEDRCGLYDLQFCEHRECSSVTSRSTLGRDACTCTVYSMCPDGGTKRLLPLYLSAHSFVAQFGTGC